MAGTILIFGGLRLDSRAVTGFSLSDGWTYPDHAVIETKPRHQWTGTAPRRATISFYWHATWCDPEAEIQKLRTLGDGVSAWPLLRGSGAWLGRFVLESLRETDRWTFSDGHPIAIDATAELTEWTGTAGDSQAAGIAGSAASALLRRMR